MRKSPEEVIREEIRALSAYHVAESEGMIKLDAMENPFRLPESLRADIGRRVEEAVLNRYPDAAARKLKLQLRQALEVPDDLELVLGNGSDELIQMLVLAAAVSGIALALVLWQAKRAGLQPNYQPPARPLSPSGVPPAPTYPLIQYPAP